MTLPLKPKDSRPRTRGIRLADEIGHQPEPVDVGVKLGLTVAASIEPSLTLAEVCRIRAVSRRTGERERSAGLWPKADYYVGTGTRKSPRWRPPTIRRWLGIERDERA